MNEIGIFLMLGGLAFLFLITSAIFGWNWFKYRFKTPARVFLQAKKKGKLLGICFGENGVMQFRVSSDRMNLLDGEDLTHLAPNSVFIERQSNVAVSPFYDSAGVNGQTLSPEFVKFVDMVEDEIKNDNFERESVLESINVMEKDLQSIPDDDPRREQKKFWRLSFSNIKKYMNYNDSVGNYNMAHKIASLEYKRSWKDVAKYIFVILAGGIVLAGIIVLVAIIGKSLGQNEVVCKCGELAVQTAKSVVNGTVIKL